MASRPNVTDMRLPEGRKYSCFDLHRKFLPLDHGFRKDKKNFTKGKVFEHEAPPMMTGAQILDQLNSLEPNPNRPVYFLGYNAEHAWTHKPCFWDLPYFKDLALPHNIDVMHTEKIWVRPFLVHCLTLIRGKIMLRLESIRTVCVIGVTEHATTEREEELGEAKGLVQS